MYRDSFTSCPVCPNQALAHRGTVLDCRSCSGTWVPEPILHEMTAYMKGLWDNSGASFVKNPRKKEQTRGCPECRRGMIQIAIEGVAVERCRDHGVWFDREELQTALHRVASPEKQSPPKATIALRFIRSLSAWLTTPSTRESIPRPAYYGPAPWPLTTLQTGKTYRCRKSVGLDEENTLESGELYLLRSSLGGIGYRLVHVASGREILYWANGPEELQAVEEALAGPGKAAESSCHSPHRVEIS